MLKQIRLSLKKKKKRKEEIKQIIVLSRINFWFRSMNVLNLYIFRCDSQKRIINYIFVQ